MNRVLALALVATLLTACGGGGGGSTPVPTSVPGTPTLNSLPTPAAVKNELRIYVDAGPDDTGYNVNRLYTDVTVCHPGMSSPGSPTQCQTINHVLVDTGSFGLRLLSSAMAPDLKLDREQVTGGPLLNCAKFVDDSFAWGPVVKADVVLGGMTAASVPIQVIADPSLDNLAETCSSGTAITNATILGANGILGIGLFKEDCGDRCNNIVNNGSYYTCTTTSCTGAKTTSLGQQVQNPVPRFLTDNNGVLIDLPGASSPGVPSLSGSLIFGIGTQSNNRWTSGAVLTTNAVGYVTTLLAGQNLPNNFTNSFIDSGSNGLFFDSTTITKCGPSGAGFYCPAPPVNLSATLVGANGAASAEILFSIDKATDLFIGGVNHVLPTLAGDFGDARSFDWGLPFFYGRRVFFGIEGQASTLGTGPFYAF